MAENEITKYDIELNSIPLGHLTSVEMNIFFSIITKMRDKKNERVIFTFDELRELSDFNDKNLKRFTDSIDKIYQKMLTLTFGRTSKSGLVKQRFIIFSEFEINQEEATPFVAVKVYEKAVPLLNEIDQWVRYSLHEFNSLKSVYAKTLFRLLKQYRTTGIAILSVEKFNELMNVPKSYKQWHINDKILEPSLEQLKPIFKNLKVEKRHAKKRGRPLKDYVFTFVPELKNSDDFKKKKRKNAPHEEISTDWERYIPKKESPKNEYTKQLSTLLGEIE